MSQLFSLSYVTLCCVVLLETLIVYSVLRKTVWLQRLYSKSARAYKSKQSNLLGAFLPFFSLPTLRPGKSLSARDFEGKGNVLFFVSADRSQSYHNLMSALHAWWHRAEGRAYVVCKGPEELCRSLVARDLQDFPLDHIICDESGVLAGGLRIVETPQAVELDEHAQVKRCGRPEDLELKVQDDAHGHLPDRPNWPDSQPMSGAGFARVDSTVSCVLSRFRLSSPLLLIPFYLAFRRVRRAAHDVDGLMQAVLLLEGPRTCYTLSFWKDDWAIVQFGSIRAHIEAANSIFSGTYRKDIKRSEIWSAQFRLWAVSCHNLEWQSLDLKTALGEQWRRREELANMKAPIEERDLV